MAQPMPMPAEIKVAPTDPADMDFIADLVKRRSGLVLSRDKAYLLESRLLPLARKQGISSIKELVSRLRAKPGDPLVHAVTDALTTNETFFFRDGRPFDSFRDQILPDALEKRAGQKSLRIWCAAASTGQEPVTLAIIIKEMEASLAGWKVEIVATDISTEALRRATDGRYSQFEVQRGLPIQMLVKYFERKESFWETRPEIRSLIKYREFNLLDDFRVLGRFDVVFCRNVLIYFDTPTKKDVLDRMRRQMPDDGILFLGGAETVLGVTESFQIISGQRGVYTTTGGAK